MSKFEKLRERFLSRPKNFTYNDLVKLLSYYGYEEVKLGKTSGSRVCFVHSDSRHIIRLHKPHPNKELKRYQIDQIINELEKKDIL